MEIDDYFKDNFPQQLNKLGNNAIYYDPNFAERPTEIYKDAEIFKIHISGAFILVMNKLSLNLVLKEIEKLNTKCKFDFVCTGGSSEEILRFIEDIFFLELKFLYNVNFP